MRGGKAKLEKSQLGQPLVENCRSEKTRVADGKK